MNRTTGGGTSLGDHYAAAARRGRRKAPQAPELPREAIPLWNLFLQLHHARPAGGMGVSPITWGEIRAFSEVTGQRLMPWQAEIIREIDQTYFASRSD